MIQVIIKFIIETKSNDLALSDDYVITGIVVVGAGFSSLFHAIIPNCRTFLC